MRSNTKNRFPLFVYLTLVISQAITANGFQAQLPSSRAKPLRYPISTYSKRATADHHEDTHPNPTSNKRRELIVKSIAIPTILPILSTVLGADNALAAQTAGEAVRRSAANIPGYGQPDVYFPASFIGKWKATRVIVASDDPFISQLNLPCIISYNVRFITVDGDTTSNGIEKVISDRQFNENSYYNAIKAELENVQTTTGGKILLPPSIQSVTWSPFNPNVCTSVYSDNSSKEIKVTKRAAELDGATGLVSSSEYRRITSVSSGSLGAIPSISASRALTKWKSDGEGRNQVVEGIEIIYSDGTIGGDPMAPGGMASGGNKPQMSSKSRLKLERADE